MRCSFSWEASNSGRLAEASKASSQGQYVARVCHICLDCLPHSGGRQVFDPLAPGCHLLQHQLDGDQCRALAVGVAPSQGQAETAPTSPGASSGLLLWVVAVEPARGILPLGAAPAPHGRHGDGLAARAASSRCAPRRARPPSQGQAETAPTSPGEDADLELKSESARRSSSPFYSRRRSGRPPGGRERRAAQLLTPPPAHSLRPYRIAYLVPTHAPRRGRAKPGAL